MSTADGNHLFPPLHCHHLKPRFTQPLYGPNLRVKLPQPLAISLILSFHLTPLFIPIHCATGMNASANRGSRQELGNNSIAFNSSEDLS